MRRVAMVLALVALPGVAWPCTTFLMSQREQVLIGKSYDWHMGQGLVVLNKRGVGKRALPMVPGDRPAQWVSRHASVTFNQYGAEMPNGGMNDAGLVMEIMWLRSSVFAPRDQRPTVNELQFIQYQLDRFATVKEVVEHLEEVRISRAHGRVHYLVCDRTGQCAALELIDGRLVVTTGDRLPVKTLTNHTYAESARYLGRHVGFGGSAPVPEGRGSLQRFVRAASLVAAGSATVDGAFSVLDSVSVGPRSQWNIVYDPIRLRAYFRTHRMPRIKHVDLGAVHGSCKDPVRVLDLGADRSGDVSAAFEPYTEAKNRALLRRSLHKVRASLPRGAMQALVTYPSRLPCVAP